MSLCSIIKQYDMNTYGVMTSVLDGANWPASHHYRFTPVERDNSTLSIEGWVCPRVGLDAVEREKSLLLPEI
jgi:hypothetical protein